ncbi:MAG: hypothetical protein MR039_05090 [Elusimicrobia bacterium]|nr:hypothetical protein [Elusimicrobiota bacterium]
MAVIKQSAVILNGGPQGFKHLPFVSLPFSRFAVFKSSSWSAVVQDLAVAFAVIKQRVVILNGGPQGFQNLPFVSSCRRRFSAHLPRHAKQFLNVW